MAAGSLLQIYPFNFKPSPPPSGSFLVYAKTDNNLYIQDSSGVEYAFASTAAITQLTGEGTAVGPGVVPLTLSNSAVIGKVLTGFTPGPNSAVLATDSILQAFQKLQAQVTASTGSAITALTSDVSATGPGSVPATVNSVGGSSAANIHAAELAANAATSINTASTIVERDASGNFAANVITASLNGNASTSTNFTGSLSGDVTGTQSTTSIASSTVTGKILTGFSIGPNSPIVATDTILQAFDKTQSQINSTTGAAITALNGDVTATGPGNVAATVNSVGGSSAANIHSAELAANAATSANTPSTIVKRDASGNFNAGTITASLSGNATTATTSINFSGSLSGDVTGTQSATAISSPTVTGKLLTGFVSGAGTVSATDSILTAIDKLDGNINTTTGSAITALTGDVVATGPGSVSSTIQSNVVSNSKLAQMPTNTLKGNNTGSTANAADLTIPQVVTMFGGTPVTQTPDQANAAGTTNTFARADHVHNIPSGVPVQIGTSNIQGSAATFSLADHVHNHGNQTVGTLHAAVTTTVNGFMSAADKVKLNAISATPGTNAQILISDGINLNPETVSGDATITNTGVVSVNTVTGIIPVNKGGTGATTAPAARVNLNIDERSTFSNVPYTVLSTDRYVAQIGTLSASRIVTLPAASSVNAGQQLTIADESGTVTTTNILTITAAGSDTINGSATKTIRAGFGYIILYSNGSNEWFTGVESIGRGGTGLSALPTDGQLLIGNTSTSSYNLSTLTAGTGITVTNAGGSITVAGNSIFPQVTKTANYTILSTDSIIFVDTSGGPFTLTLPSPTALAGKVYRIIGTSGTMNTNNLTLAPSGAEKIEGLAASKVFQTNWGGWQVTTNGTDWFVF